MIDLNHLSGFDWDEGNREKNWQKHQVSTGECEEAFFYQPLLLRDDQIHSKVESRYLVLGKTNAGRNLLIAFTVRGDTIHVISARDMNKKKRVPFMSKPIPEFQSEDEEREFWATHDSSEYVDWSQAERVAFPNLKPTTRAISLRLPVSMLDELRQLANQRDVPYQSLIKIFLRERMDMEHGGNPWLSAAVPEGRVGYQIKRKKG